jgi:nucleotide-binding universal stress UspA family protein
MISGASSTHHIVDTSQGVLPPYSRILVPLDGSALAEEALPTAIAFVQRAGKTGKLILLRVTHMEYLVYSRGGPFEVPGGVHQEVDAYLARLEAQMKSDGVPVEVVRAEGEPAIAIVEIAHDHHADLTIMVTHAREGMSRLVHGSITDRVLQASSVPVLLLKHGEQPDRVFSIQGRSHLLVPLDGSEVAESVLLRALSLASQMGASMTLLRSLDLPDLTVSGTRMGGLTPADIGVIMPAARQQAMQYLQQMQERVQAHGIPTAVLVTEGGAAEDIAGQAKELEQAGYAVMIVMATHGRTGVGRWLYGSVAGAVLHLADVPLLVVRPR